MRKHRNLTAALHQWPREQVRDTKILLSDDGRFALHHCPGQDPNFIDLEANHAEGRQIMHRYIRTGLVSMGMRIYVLHEVVGADVEEMLRSLGRGPRESEDGWNEHEFEARTAWMPGHRAGRRDHGYSRGIPKRRVGVGG